jgi:flagellar motility protein MotE (MotC chaperone)
MFNLLKKIGKKIKSFSSSIMPNNKRFIYNTPSIPWSNGLFPGDILDEDLHLEPLNAILKQFCPDLYQQLRWVVLESARQAKREEPKLDELETQRENLTTEAAACEAAMDKVVESPSPDFTVEEEPTEPWFTPILTIGLSIMLFLGLCEYLGVKIYDLDWDQTIPLLEALFGAVCINLGEKLAIETFVESHRRYEPQRNHSDDEEMKNLIPFWSRYASGDSAIWAATFIVVCEVGFATPGLISLLPPSASSSIVMQLIALSAAGLAAVVNVFMAWGNAQAKINWRREKLTIQAAEQQWIEAERERLAQSEPISDEQREFRVRAAAAKSRLKVVEQRILAQQERLSDAKERARLEYERWEYAVKRWLSENEAKVERYRNSYSSMNSPEIHLYPPEANGHQAIKNIDFSN